MKLTKHFVTFLSPGTFVSEETTQPIDSWDVEKATKMAHGIKERHAATPYGFQFSTRTRKDDELDSSETKRSGTYFLGGEILTLAQVEKQMPEEEILISNMRNNRIKRVIVNRNSWKTVMPFTDEDTLLEFSVEVNQKMKL